jgi:tripartite ATP-independent transporter DctP family solute receptor
MKLVFAIAAVAALSSPACFAAKKTIKFGTIAPANTPWSDTLEEIKKRVEAESKGELGIKVYLGGQLGGELEILQGIRRGRIEGGGLTSAALASVIPELDVLELPYLFESSAQADCVLDQHLLEPFKKLFDEKGLVFVTWAENGWRSIGTKKKPIKSPSDLKGLKVRSQESKVHLGFWKKLEANPAPIAVPEVLPSLQTGVVEGFDNTPLFTLAAEWHTAIKYYTVSQHIYQPAAVVYSKSYFSKLSEAEQKTLMGEGNGLAVKARTAVRKLEGELIGVLKDSGIQVTELSATEKQSFKKAVDGINDSLIKQIGGKANEIYAKVLEGKKACGKK